MNNTALKWILTANCLIAASASFAGSQQNLRIPVADTNTQQHKTMTVDKSKFHYMDALPIYSSHHVRAAVMMLEKKPGKQNQCGALKGEAKHRCYELSMPT